MSATCGQLEGMHMSRTSKRHYPTHSAAKIWVQQNFSSGRNLQEQMVEIPRSTSAALLKTYCSASNHSKVNISKGECENLCYAALWNSYFIRQSLRVL
jgi:hypothetical protein